MAAGSPAPEDGSADPPPDCRRCTRLADYRAALRSREPDWHNAPVPSFGDDAGRLLVVGLAPGAAGANRTGRPFTGDHAGDLLYATLAEFGFSVGTFRARPDDGLALVDCRITNAVRCVPPENKPTPAEIRACRPYFTAAMDRMANLTAIVALGRIAHDQVLAARGLKRSAFPFAHGAIHSLPDRVTLFDSFHCSRYNTSTRKLTPDMFRAVFAEVARSLRR